MEQILSVRIRDTLCNGCGICAEDCPSRNIEIREGKAVLKSVTCMECGHCFAICPVGAAELPAYDTAGCGCLGSLADFDEDDLLLGMKSRRSVRQFKKQKVEPEKIEKILEAGRYAPTAGNRQPNSYIVIDKKISDMERLAYETFERFRGKAEAVSSRLAAVELTEDFFFKGGPQAVLILSENELDAGLAASYMELMAESMGLGTLYSGFFVVAARLGEEIRQELEIGEHEKVAACLVIGYPDVQYQRIVPRLPLRVRKK